MGRGGYAGNHALRRAGSYTQCSVAAGCRRYEKTRYCCLKTDLPSYTRRPVAAGCRRYEKREAVALKRIFLRLRNAHGGVDAAATAKAQSRAPYWIMLLYATPMAADCRRYEKTRGCCLRMDLPSYTQCPWRQVAAAAGGRNRVLLNGNFSPALSPEYPFSTRLPFLRSCRRS